MDQGTREVVTSEEVRLHLTVFGEGPRTLLLLHGWPNSGRIWQEFAATMQTAGNPYRLICPDFRGYGLSDKPPTGYTCSQFAEDMDEVLESLGIVEWSLIGHSMGGKIAQALATARPPGLRALILLAPAPLVVAVPVPEDKKAAQRAAWGNRDKIAALTESMAARPLSAEIKERLIEDGLRTSREAWDGWIDEMRDEDLSDWLPAIDVPTLVIGGIKDTLRTEDALRRNVVARIISATAEMLPGVGHLLAVEDPDGLALAVVNFLDTVSWNETEAA